MIPCEIGNGVGEYDDRFGAAIGASIGIGHGQGHVVETWAWEQIGRILRVGRLARTKVPLPRSDRRLRCRCIGKHHGGTVTNIVEIEIYLWQWVHNHAFGDSVAAAVGTFNDQLHIIGTGCGESMGGVLNL